MDENLNGDLNMYDCKMPYFRFGDNGVEDIRFPGKDEYYELSPCITVITGDETFDVHNFSKVFMGLDKSNMAYIWNDTPKRMHPSILREEAEHIIAFAEKGYKWIIFSDSLFFIKEIKLLSKEKGLDLKYLNLYSKDGELNVEESDDMYSLRNFSLLNESISQFNREINLHKPSFVE